MKCAAVSALGNLGDRKAVEPLIETLCSSSKLVSDAAAVALEQLGESKWKRIFTGDIPYIKSGSEPRALMLLKKAFRNGNKAVAEILVAFGDVEAIELLEKASKNKRCEECGQIMIPIMEYIHDERFTRGVKFICCACGNKKTIDYEEYEANRKSGECPYCGNPIWGRLPTVCSQCGSELPHVPASDGHWGDVDIGDDIFIPGWRDYMTHGYLYTKEELRVYRIKS